MRNERWKEGSKGGKVGVYVPEYKIRKETIMFRCLRIYTIKSIYNIFEQKITFKRDEIKSLWREKI